MKSRYSRPRALRLLSLALALGTLSAPFAAPPLRAQTLADEPQRALRNSGFLDDVSGWELLQGSTRSRMQSVALAPGDAGGDAGGNGRALRVEVKSPVGADAFTVQLRQEIGVALTSGQTVRLSFWARSPQSANLGAVIEDKATYAKVLEQPLQLTPNWKRYEVSGQSAADFAARATTVNFQMGGQTATIELADVRIEDPAHPLPTDFKQLSTPRGSLQKPLALVQGSNDFATDWENTAIQTTRFVADIGGQKLPAVKIEVPAKTANPWEAKIASPNPRAIVGGDTVALRAWARSETGNTVSFVFQKSSGDYQKFITQTVALTPDWKEYRFVATLDGAAGLGANGSNFELQVGADKGTIELADVRVESYGAATRAQVFAKVGPETVDYYGGREHNDDWRAPALARIEQLRKAPLRVRVIDDKGEPVSGAQVQLNLTRHAFHWGTAAPAALLADGSDADAVKFQQVLKRNFNTVTLENDLKWRDVSAQDQSVIDGALRWLRASDIEVRGHNLVWGSYQYLPKNLDGKPVAELSNDEWKTLLARRVADQAGRYRGQVYAWDVVNEATSERELWYKIGWDNFANTFAQARRADTNALLSYNDYFALNRTGETPQWTREREVIKLLIDAKVPLDTIAEQAHLGTPLVPISQILKNLDELAALGKPIEITEFDLSLPNEEVNAQYLRDFLIAAFSHPDVVNITQWGFWQGAHWRGSEGAGLYNRDWTPRPAAQAYQDLVLNQWWTREKGVTGANGQLATRGFLGDYAVTVSGGGKTRTAYYKLSKEAPELVVTLG